MSLSQEDFEEIFEIFKVECDEHIQNLNRALISLEENPEQSDLIELIFREAHSLKGAARMIDLKKIEEIAHHMETILGKIKNEELKFSEDVNTLTLKGLDTIERIVGTISNGGAEEDADASSILRELKTLSEQHASDQKISSGKKIKKTVSEKKIKKKEIKKEIKRDLSLFSEETRMACTLLLDSLVEIEKTGDDSKKVKTAFESAHALKGSARIVKHQEMGDLAFSMEKLIKAVLEKKKTFSNEMIVCLLEASKLIEVFIVQVEKQEASVIPSNYLKIWSVLDRLSEEANASKDRGVKASKENHAGRKPRDLKKTEAPVVTVSEIKTEKSHQAILKNTASSVRVSSEKLDSLMGQAGELLIMKLKARQRLMDTQSIIDGFGGLSREIKNKCTQTRKTQRAGDDFLDQEKTDLFHTFLEKIGGEYSHVSEQLENLHKSLFDDYRQFSIIIDRLQDDVRKTRLFPFQTVLDTFPRMVRDLSSSLKKKVKLETFGASIELDKYILEHIKDPLMHIIRNCIDHGIESQEERMNLGKPETGVVKVEAVQKGNNAVIKVSDDGKGISLERIRASAIKKAIYTADEINQMKEKQVLNLIFHPGFSTNEIITDISGRGVGMDVVKSNIEKLNGTIDIDTREGQGSVFSMLIPLTLSTTQTLKIFVAGETFFLPVSMVERIVKVVENDLPVIEGFPAIHYCGSYIPYVRLSSILELSDEKAEEDATTEVEKSVAILKSGRVLAAFGIDLFLGEEEILMKGLGPYMLRIRNILGVTIMRDGTIAPVLNVGDIINTVQLRKITSTKREKPSQKHTRVQSILVVDDSIMTRTLTKNIIESYGYLVMTAFDGEDALNKLQQKEFDLIVSDVQMPNMDGLELTHFIKQDKHLKDKPVILVTALESVEDKKRGIDVGADAYIVKSSFDQSNLIQTIKRLL